MSNTRFVAWSIWIIASIFYAYQYILRVMPSIMADDIMQQFNIGAATFGQFSGVYYIGYSLLHMPIGIMLDRYGPRKVMAGCLLLTVTGLLPLIYTDNWIYPIVGRVLIGIGSSAAILGVFKIIRISFSKEKFPLMLSISVTIGLLGAIYGGGPLDYLTKQLGFHAVVQLSALAGIILAAATYWIVPEVKTSQESTVFSDIKEVLSNPRVIACCLCAGLMVGPLEGFADVWGSLFFKQVYGYEGTLAASLPSMIFVGMCFGAPLLSLVAARMGSYLAAIVGAGLLMAIGFCTLLLFQLNVTVISMSFAIIGVCCAYQILALYQASTYVREDIAGLTTALANMIIMAFGYGFHTVIGATVNALGGIGSTHALEYGIAAIPIALFIGTAGFAILLLQERSQPVIINA
jgi:predicted MFS family arabinose efflux permease